MSTHNQDVVNVFEQIADLLKIKGENRFRIRAYRHAARTMAGLSKNIADILKEQKDLTQLSGIGKDLAGKIKEIIDSGKCKFLDDLKKNLPGQLSELMSISGLGARRVKTIYDKLQIASIDELSQAAKKKEIRKLDGFGAKTEQSILEGIDRFKEGKKRLKLPIVEQYARPLVEYLKKDKSLKEITIAGSYRRRLETVGDLDILITCKRGSNVTKRFTQYEDVKKVTSSGKTRSSVLLKSGLQVDLRVVSQKSYGAALHYFTGSKEHNVALRKMAVKRKMKINEYGLFRGKKSLAGQTESGIYKKLKLSFVEPELREDRGEIEAAQKNKLPKLITLKDIKGDLHMHTKATDGKNTLKEMATAAKEKGYEYMANTEHSKHVTVAGGLNEKQLSKHIKKIDQLNKKLKGIVILKGIEVDILDNGSLDLPASILKDLDIVVAAIHYKFRLSRDQQTKRVLKAIGHPYVNILAHPTGRMIHERPACDIDLKRVMKAAKEAGCAMELNAHPQRLDLNDIHCKMAKEMGVKVAISTDAHGTDDLDLVRYGLDQARRGWLEKADVINTRSLRQLRRFLKR